MDKKKSVVALIVKGKKVLIGKKRKKKGKNRDGAWHIPSGKIKEGERRKEALEREMKEELGEDSSIKILEFLGRYETQKGVASWYKCSFSGKISPASDLEEAVFVSGKKAFEICGRRSGEWPQIVKKMLKCL
ncbi:MAG: NUDIX domain-containing protein [Candidatus Pacebacteria bacterium]|nr:NUDIX domain-containing protein [Candidatus Paceibacterota bacterium]